ncbi:MAG: tetratricopeptide repeat protein [Litoreibacter sp.]|nr:tetratricopeptide repeat protein [Litoreibacter sp.]
MKLRNTTAVLLAAALMAAPLKAEVSGPYLAARSASLASDYADAVAYFARAIAQDPSNLLLLESAVQANIGAGNLDAAARVANTYLEAGGASPVVQLVSNVAAFKQGNYAPAAQETTQTDGLGMLIDRLLQAWAHLGEGQMAQAQSVLAKLAEEGDLAQVAHFHEALMLAQVGDFEGAQDIFSGERYGPLSMTMRGFEAQAQVLVQLDRRDDALELLSAATASGFNPELRALADRITTSEEVIYDFVTTPQDGGAEVLFTLAAILQGRAAPETVLLYTRLTNYLRPVHPQASIMSAEMLEDIEQYKLAEDAYAEVPSDHPAHFLAEMGRAQALFRDDRRDAAIEVLSALSKEYPDRPRVFAALGDFLGRTDRDEEAIEAYTNSVELRAADDARAWPVYYARGIVHERIGNYPEMEADFRKALEFEPNQPDVLNYLGYSLVEQRMKLDEALQMIETAVAERPQSGYITDSLGWVFYRLGRYEEAVAPMEKAVSLLPVDPIVNDHLGDVYWKVGRFREAEFQWKRALSFDPEEEEAERIRRKLEVGLDQVLEEEGATTGTDN